MIQVFKFPRETILDSHVTNCGFATVGQVAAWKPEYNFIINGDGWPDGFSHHLFIPNPLLSMYTTPVPVVLIK